MRLKKYERDADHAYTFGVFPTLELLNHQPRHVREVVATTAGESNEGVSKIRALCQQQRIPFEVNDKLVARLAPKENTYAVGVFGKYEMRLEAGANHVALVKPADMGNLGTILRTLLGFGLANLALIRPAADIFDPRVIRASMGALFQANAAYFDSFESYHAAYNTHHLYPFMTDGAVSAREAVFEAPFTLVFGSESKGLPDTFHTRGSSVSIPYRPAVDSLNLAVAVGIGVYEATRGSI